MKFDARETSKLLDRLSRNKRHNDRLSSCFQSKVLEEQVPQSSIRDSDILKTPLILEVGNRYIN